jgi:polyisoprenoid-binding protein YceI
MISKVRGRFREFRGTAIIAEDPRQSSVEVVISAASIDTGDAERDRHLRSADFLDVERYPDITFHSSSVEPAPHDHWEVSGLLTIRACTRPVTIAVELGGVAVDPWNQVRAGILASAEIDREDFDITWNQALEAGGFLVGKGVKIEADVELVLDSEAEPG